VNENQSLTDEGAGVIERFFDHLIAGDWVAFGELLSPDVERTGLFGDRVVGRDRYVEMMKMSRSGTGTTWVVHRVAYTPDGRSGFARVTAYPPNADRFEETLAFEIDHVGLVCGVEAFWQTPQFAPPSLGSARSQDG
jgi:hypothetical protein